MLKSFARGILIATLALGGVSAATAQEVPPDPTIDNWQFLDQNTVRGCDASACYTYWYVGGDTWVLVNVEPRPRGGGREVN